jgi:sortase A
MLLQINPQAGCRARRLWLLHWCQYALLTVGILALAYYGFVVIDTMFYQAQQTKQFEQDLVNATIASPSGERPNSLLDTGLPLMRATPSNLVGAVIPSRTDLLLGQIEIRKIGLAAMILEGTDNHTLRHAVGHVKETALPGQPGNVAIAGHRDTFFRGLRNITRDDEITLTTLHGSFHYVVDFSEVVGPDQTTVLAPSNDSILTLVTCYPFSYIGPAPKRLIVRAHLSE